MSKEKIQAALKDALEEEIPGSQINLWPAVKADLAAGKQFPIKQGSKMNNTQSRRIPRLALALTLFLLLAAIFFASPQGRTLAQSVVEFFTRAEETTFPLDDSQIAPAEPDENAPTAEPPAPLISADEAAAQAGFDIAELPEVPEGFEYLGARLYGKNVSIEYQVPGGGSSLIIMQSQEGYYQSDWDKVPSDSVVPVRIGDLDGEFTQGTFVVFPGDTEAIWNPDAPILRLRWVDDGVWFEMTKFGDVQLTEYLDMAEMIKLAENLAVLP